MKFRLALLDKDTSYLQRLVVALNTRYPELEVSSFTDVEYALQSMAALKPEVFIAGSDLGVDVNRVPGECGMGYFSDDNSVEKINGLPAVGKFQKVDMIYRQILNVYAESGKDGKYKSGDESTRIFVFTSPCGGAGSSTMAASCAAHFAAEGDKVLYLNIEKFGCADVFFSGAGLLDMSEIIFALKSRKANLAVKLESSVKQDACGVYFYSKAKLALDMLELNGEEVLTLVNEIKEAGVYKYVVVDMDFGLDKYSMEVYKNANTIVWCTDGSDTNNAKLVRAYEAVSIMEKDGDLRITERTAILYNKHCASSKSASVDANSIGAIPYAEQTSAQDSVKKFAQLDVFEKLLK